MNTNTLAPTTELEAVNIILTAIGESPISTLVDSTTDVSIASSILHEVSKEVQSEGWHWNIEDNFPLIANSEGYINIPSNIIRVYFTTHTDKDIIIRGSRIYDKTNHTYTFKQGDTIYARILTLLPFTELPETARRYIILKAVRIFQERVVGSQVLSQYQQRDETMARINLYGEESSLNRPNMITGSDPNSSAWNASLTNLHRKGRLYG